MRASMGSPRRITLLVSTSAAVALLASVAAANLYPYTDDELTGPEQPIAFSHQVHATTLGIDCLYCHTGADKSQHATVPAVSTCMGCHQFVKQGSTPGSAEEIAKIRSYWCAEGETGPSCDKGTSIPWVRIHNLPEHVQFKHFRHVNAGVACQTCHGPVEQMNRVWLTPDTKLRPSSAYLPAAKLEMGWCMDCHLQGQETGQQRASDDCAACHF
jgi:hypothetical protein